VILIVSNSDDWSTNDVVEWLRHKKAHFTRLNFDKIQAADLEMRINKNQSAIKIHGFEGESTLSEEEVSIIWFRRSSKVNFVSLLDTTLTPTTRRIMETIDTEAKYFHRAVFHLLGKNKKWLNNFFSSFNDKIETLVKAQEIGIDVPDTMMTFSKEIALRFIEEHEHVVLKPIYNIEMMNINAALYMPYTRRITTEDLIDFKPHLFPLLLQAEIPKKYEIRSFFLDGRFFSMAIFSQRSRQTMVDFRKYDHNMPSRRVPYQLPVALENQLSELMNQLNLNCGSIDIIRATDGRHLFLEVNPVGQFGMVSYPCNYYLEDEIAKYLTSHDQ